MIKTPIRTIVPALQILLAMAASAFADPLVWTSLTPSPRSATINDAARIPNGFLLAGANGAIHWSADGSHWLTANVGTIHDLDSIATDGDTTVVVGEWNTILASDDGLVWDIVATPLQSGDFEAVCHGEDGFVAVTHSGIITHSTDGRTWSEDLAPQGSFLTFRDVASGQGMYVAVGNNRRVFVSDDGVEWTSRDTPFSSPYAIACSGSLWMVLANRNEVWTSPDAIVWTRAVGVSRASHLQWNEILNRFLAIDGSGTILSSEDGMHWRIESTPNVKGLRAMTVSQDKWIAAGAFGSIFSKDDDDEWTDCSIQYAPPLYGIAASDSAKVAVGADGVILRSLDGERWDVMPSPVSSDLHSVCWTGKSFLAVGDNGVILRSPDGADWFAEDSGTRSALYTVVHANGKSIAGGNHDTILVHNGSQWQPRHNDIYGGSIQGIAWNGQRYVATGTKSILVSDNAITWNSVETDGYQPSFGALVWANDEFIAPIRQDLSQTGIFVSPDGLTWTKPAIAGISGNSDIVALGFADGRLLATDDHGGVYVSLDGRQWTCVSPPVASTGTSALFHTGSHAWVVRSDGAILRSDDLHAWRQNGLPQTGIVFHTGTRLGVFGKNGMVATSRDGVEWVIRDTGFYGSSVEWLAGVSNDSVTVVVGSEGKIIRSTDLVSWQTVYSQGSIRLLDVAWNGRSFLAVGTGQTILSSQDGQAWHTCHTGYSYKLSSIAWTGSEWIVGGEQGYVFRSSDGENWTLDKVSSLYWPVVVLAPGNDILFASIDGIWEQHPGADWEKVAIGGSHFTAGVCTARGCLITSTNFTDNIARRTPDGAWSLSSQLMTPLFTDLFRIGNQIVGTRSTGSVLLINEEEFKPVSIWAASHNAPIDKRGPDDFGVSRILPNLLCYALNLPDGQFDSGQPSIIVQAGERHPVFQFKRGPRMPGVRLFVERWIPDSGTPGWETIAAETEHGWSGLVPVDEEADESGLVTVKMQVDSGSSCALFRLASSVAE
jgi:hypothetical protein